MPIAWRFLFVIALTAACEANHEDGHLFFSGYPYPSVPGEAGRGVRLELIKEYGDLEHGLVFGQIRALAVSSEGTLAVFDRDECRVWMIGTKTGEWVTRGRCGDGPGEFRSVSAMTFSGDTLLLYDEERASIARLGPDGTEIDRVTLPLAELGVTRVADLSVGESGSILAGLHLMPNGRTRQHHQIASFSSSGDLVESGVSAPLIAQRTPRPIVRYGSMCVGSSGIHGDVVWVLNTWGPQALLVRRRGFSVVRSVMVPIDWARATEHSTRAGHWGPMWPLPEAACGDELALVGYRKQRNTVENAWEVTSAFLLALDYEGHLVDVIGGDQAPDPGSVLFMTPGAALGDRFFFFSNSFLGYPVVREYRTIATGSDP